jgi:hypothetical protein
MLGIVGNSSAFVGFWLRPFPYCSILLPFEGVKPDTPD